jgi:hypothetical protein
VESSADVPSAPGKSNPNLIIHEIDQSRGVPSAMESKLEQ